MVSYSITIARCLEAIISKLKFIYLCPKAIYFCPYPSLFRHKRQAFVRKKTNITHKRLDMGKNG